MALRYHYNANTCKYEPIVVSPRKFTNQVFQFLGISLLIGMGGVGYYNTQFPFVDEINLRKENDELKTAWHAIHADLKKTSDQLTQLEKNDDHNFRVILGLDPLSSTQR